jgi:hypothetical protein
MRKFSQRELLSEGFWDSFKNTVRGVSTFGAEMARKIAPEITDPLDKTEAWFRGTKEKVDAARDPVGAVKSFLIDNGYFPISDIVPHKKGKLQGSDKGKGGRNYIAKVVELEYGDDGIAQPSQNTYTNPVAIVSMDKDYRMTFLKRPRRDFAKDVNKKKNVNKKKKVNPPVNPPPVQQQSQTPP